MTFGQSNAEKAREEARAKEIEAREKKQAEKDRIDKEKSDKTLEQIAEARKKNGLAPLEFGRDATIRLPKVKEKK
jgi:DNA-binding transcriptional regulator YiaG